MYVLSLFIPQKPSLRLCDKSCEPPSIMLKTQTFIFLKDFDKILKTNMFSIIIFKNKDDKPKVIPFIQIQ